ncbi:hypothetical protein PtA15_3A384 [Puccinia triticina]|uniref:Uncharacterized protein n=1 Tax=Puccinia triticina TaxID=208348 RepID=A0ABY7CCS0_9BASI|nr:uncharacterized protein PtA15_3A384 [Puccinia triticina]WAQ83018.1 hypothetical protein PtA15_3A384 [Puccinia triticina]
MPARHRDTTSSGRENHRMKGTGAGLPEHIQTNNAAGGPTPSQTLVFLTTRRDATFSSNLLIKAYLKNPANPVPFPLLLMKTGWGTSVPRKLVSGGTLSTPKPSRAGMNVSERSLPPRLNGPLLRIRSNNNHNSRRVDSLFYGPVDPVLVDPSVNHYYTFPALEEALMAPLNCYECKLFDPVILQSSLSI